MGHSLLHTILLVVRLYSTLLNTVGNAAVILPNYIMVIERLSRQHHYDVLKKFKNNAVIVQLVAITAEIFRI